MLLNNHKKLLFSVLSIALLLCSVQTAIQLVRFSQIELTGTFIPDFLVEDFSIQKLIVSALFVSLSFIYLFWLVREKLNFLATAKINLWVALLLCLSFLTYPYSSDIYLYLHVGQMVLHGVNPYLTPAGSFASVLSPFLVWSQTSTYGPIAQLFFAIATLATPLSPLLAVYVFKLFCLLFHLLNTRLIWQFLPNTAYRKSITLAYLLNPLLLYEQVANAHVDVFLTTAIILLIGCLYQRRFVLAIAALWAGFLTKTLLIIWLPLLVSYLIKQRYWKSLAISFLLSLMIVAMLSITILPTVDAWRSLFNPGVSGKTARSLHHSLNLLLNFGTNWTAETKQHLLAGFTLLTTVGFASFYSWLLLRPHFRRNQPEPPLVADMGWVTLVLLLLATPWMMPWYPSILLPFAALSPHTPLLALTSLIFCASIDTFVAGGYGYSLFELLTSLCTVIPSLFVLAFGRRWGVGGGE